MTRGLVALAALATLAAPGSTAAKGKQPDLLPFSLAVEVRWGSGNGPEAFRADVERAVATAAAHGCVAEISTGASAASGGTSDLVLVATLEGFVEELRFDDSLATAVTPGEPTKELRRVAMVDVDNTLQLYVREGAREVATKSFHAGVQYRPMYVGEEPQVSARARVIEDIVDESRKLLCKSGGKLAARVRGEPGAR
ncbi:MAG TPA: hypothetical protein VJ826_06515 [Candidatus Polarisedimenticolaceae bacterium]|nr:hypothetical protein [Candidatus Polarisedimenticolaceae bacterium]